MHDILQALRSWKPDRSRVLTTIEAHTGGEPLRIIIDGYPFIKGDSILEKRRYLASNLDKVRTRLMWEPRGHSDMYGCIIVEPELASSDFGILFLHNAGYSTMCGHGIIAVSVVADKLLYGESDKPTIKIDSPAGPITVLRNKRAGASATFLNVASYVSLLDAKVDVPGLGPVRYDLAFGGAYYAFVEAASVGLTCVPSNTDELISVAGKIKAAITSSSNIIHPVHRDLSFLYGVIFTDESPDESCHSRHVCVFADGEVDRSPTGTGVSARAALLVERDELSTGQSVTIDSILGSKFRVSVAALTRYSGYRAVIPEVTGTAFITGRHEFFIDEEDPLADGFLLR